MTDYGPYQDRMIAAGLPVAGIRVAGGVPSVVWSATPTSQQQSQADAILADPLNGPRVRRPLYLIYNSLAALSAGNKAAVWADLSGGSPRKYLLDAGPNAAALWAAHLVILNVALAGSALTQAQMMLTALYCQDVPAYLRNPPFAPSINVSGDQAA